MSPAINNFLLRLKSIFRSQRLDRDMAEELEFHQALLREKLLQEGVPASQVDQATRKTFGNPSRWQERLHELWQFRSLEILKRDVLFSIRLLRKSPGFTTIALLTLVLGVGANTAVFSLVNGLLLRPLPSPHSDELIVIRLDRDSQRSAYSLPAPFFRALEKNHDLFASMMAFSYRDKLLVNGRTTNENATGALVSGEYFQALQISPLMGRYLTPADDQPGGSPQGVAIVISESYWRTRLNSDPQVIGHTLSIANTAFTVVGVMPKSFTGADPTQRADIYVPLSAEPVIDAPEDLIKAGFHGWWLIVMGRRQPGVTLDSLNAALQPISMPILRDTVPDASWVDQMEKRHCHFTAEPGARGFNYLRSIFQKPLVALFCMCGGILLLACLNLASLLTARGAARGRELATRLALGATRKRLVQQMLIESMLIAVTGTSIGLALAPAISHALAMALLNGSGREIYLDTSIDLRVLAFSSTTACLASILIGLAPALLATSGNLSDQIKDGQHTTRTLERRRLFPKVLLAAEVGLALLLVVCSGLLATSLYRLYRSDIGFDPNGVVNVELIMDKQPLDGDALMHFYRQFGESLSHQPGVTSVSFARIIPLTHTVWDDDHLVPGGTPHDLYMNAVAPDYFKTMRIAMFSGRDFQWSDSKDAGLKIILNQAAAKLFFPGRDALGQHLRRQQKSIDYEVIAVVADAKYDDLHSAAPATAYLPLTEFEGVKPSYFAVVRSNGPVAPLAVEARLLARQLAPEIPPPGVTTMSGTLSASIATEMVMAMLSLFFAACALLVAGIGLYGTLAYNTSRRTSEIGIRIALGAQRRSVVALVFGENAAVAAFGSAIGLAAALFASRILASFLYQTSPYDPWILFLSVAALTAIASAASLLPAIRAARIEPISAIRYE